MSSTEGPGDVIPAALPPLGVEPNFEKPEWIGYRLIIVCVVFPVLSLFFLIPRLYSAAFIIRKWRTDDYLICIGFAFALANSIICITQSTMGMGYHIWDLDFDTFKATMKLGMIGGAMTYQLCTLFVKLSILSFYLRFSVDRSFRMAVYAVMFIAVGYTIPNALLFLYICKPIPFYWDWTIPGGTCINQQAVFDSANILNMSTDFLILLLPIWMLRPLRVPLLKKIGIAVILAAGGFVCGISTMRMITAMMGADNPDITWHYPVNLIWCLVEEYTGILCACLPCLKPFSKRFFPNLFLFSPAFEQRVSDSFPFSSFRLNASTRTRIATANNAGAENNGNAEGKEKDAGGRRAWWRMQGGVGRGGGEGDGEGGFKGSNTEKRSVDENGGDVGHRACSSVGELSAGDSKTLADAAVVKEV